MEQNSIIFIKALNKVQACLTDAKRDASNPHLKSKYATLGSVWDVIRKPLTENGFAITQTMEVLSAAEKTQWVLKTTLWHEGGHSVSSVTPIINSKGDAQGMGSALTYARRYALLGLIGVCPDDDDGEGAKASIQKGPAPIKPSQVNWEQKGSTEKQAALILAMAQKLNMTKINVTNLIFERFKKNALTELTQREASLVIDDLRAALGQTVSKTH